MKLEINLIPFVVSILWLCVALSLACGKLQQFIKFDSIDSEMFSFILCGGMGAIGLVLSFKTKI